VLSREGDVWCMGTIVRCMGTIVPATCKQLYFGMCLVYGGGGLGLDGGTRSRVC
jgi:hypothetical protein